MQGAGRKICTSLGVNFDSIYKGPKNGGTCLTAKQIDQILAAL
jgi:hypothetical protein